MSANGEMAPWRRSRAARLLLAIVILAGVSGAVHTFVRVGTGLTQVFYDGVGAGAVRRTEQRVQTIDLRVLERAETQARPENVSVRWSGVWFIPDDGLYDLLLDADDRAIWTVDGQRAHTRTFGDGATARRTVWLHAGFHSIVIEYQQDGGEYRLDVSWAQAGGVPRPLAAVDLLPVMPGRPRLFVALRAADQALSRLFVVGLIIVGLMGLRWLSAHVLGAVTERGRRAGVAVARLLLILIASYAALLRLEAITVKYGAVQHPSWLRALQEQAVATAPSLRPTAMTWTPVDPSPHKDGRSSRYTSDPYTYLLYAREMRSFYGAHYREPVFPTATRVFLWWLHDQDVAVSFASATFSILTVVAAYFVGLAAFGSPWIGLGAALGMAIERDVIAWSVSGWRDDAFAFAVLLAVYALLVYRQKPSIGRAVTLGAVAAFACLTRVFSLSFLVPGFLCILLRSPGQWRDRFRGVAIATATMAVLVLPYLVNCWRVYGDPFYSLNYQPRAYLEWEGAQTSTPPGAFGYISQKARTAPFRTADTAVLGMTSYPFLNKWSGFDPWLPGFGSALAAAALVGLLLFLASENGRLLLIVLASAQVPFAFTWRLSADWRYTEFAYPFFLLAAGAAIGHVLTLAWRPIRLRWPPLRPVRLALAVCALLVAGAAIWIVNRTLPALALRESLASDGYAIVQAGERDGSFFVEGWSRPMTSGNVTSRVSQGPFQVLSIPLPGAVDYTMLLRMDPFPRPAVGAVTPALLRVFMNGTPVASLELRWNPDRVGAYPIQVPAQVVTSGENRMVLMLEGGEPSTSGGAPVQPGLSEWSAFSFWNVFIRPL